MKSTDQRQAPASPAPPARVRLLVQQDRTGRGLLDGGWWPQTNDPAAELLVTIPSQAAEQGAYAAMRQAVTAGNREHSPAIFAAITVPAADSESSSGPGPAW
jgi:hypothetical protein